MPRIRKTPLYPVALSPACAAESLGLRRAIVAEAVRTGAIPTYKKGLSVRILTVDLEQWVRNWKGKGHVKPDQSN